MYLQNLLLKYPSSAKEPCTPLGASNKPYYSNVKSQGTLKATSLPFQTPPNCQGILQPNHHLEATLLLKTHIMSQGSLLSKHPLPLSKILIPSPNTLGVYSYLNQASHTKISLWLHNESPRIQVNRSC